MVNSKRSNHFIAVVVIAIAMSIYAYLRLSTNPLIFLIIVSLIGILEVVQLAAQYRKRTKVDLGFEAAYTIVLIAVLIGATRPPLHIRPMFMLATILYRPYYLRHGNRTLAFVVSLLIAAVVLPVAYGTVGDPGIVEIFNWSYAFLVLLLWLFCSRLRELVTSNPS